LDDLVKTKKLMFWVKHHTFDCLFTGILTRATEARKLICFKLDEIA